MGAALNSTIGNADNQSLPPLLWEDRLSQMRFPPLSPKVIEADDGWMKARTLNRNFFDTLLYGYSNFSTDKDVLPFSSFLKMSLPLITENLTAAYDDLKKLFQFNIDLIYDNSTNGSSLIDIPPQITNITQPNLCDIDVGAVSRSWERITLLAGGLSTAVVIAVLNFCVILTFIKCPDIRNTPQNLYILNLAICDFCVGINSLPGVTLYFYNMCWPYGVSLCQIMTNMDWITSTETGISMCLVAYDRLQLVRLGALYSQQESYNVVVRRILLSWLVVILLLCPGFFMPYYTGVSANALGDCINEIYQMEFFSTAVATITGTVPPLTLAIIYYFVYLRMRTRRRGSLKSASQAAREERRQRRTARGMKFLSAVFFVSWIPPTIFDLTMSMIKNIPALNSLRLDDDNQIVLRLITFLKFWIYLNSVVNPFLYAFAFRAIRSGLERTFLPANYRRAIEQRRRGANTERNALKNSKFVKPNENSVSLQRSVSDEVKSKNAAKAAGKRIVTASVPSEMEVYFEPPKQASRSWLQVQRPKIKLRASLMSSTMNDYRVSDKKKNPSEPASGPPSNSDSRSSIVINLAAINYNTIMMSKSE